MITTSHQGGGSAAADYLHGSRPGFWHQASCAQKLDRGVYEGIKVQLSSTFFCWNMQPVSAQLQQPCMKPLLIRMHTCICFVSHKQSSLIAAAMQAQDECLVLLMPAHQARIAIATLLCDQYVYAQHAPDGHQLLWRSLMEL